MRKAIAIKFLFLCVGLAAVLAAGGLAWAKDAVVAAVSAPTPNNAIIVRNGTEYSQGTYAIGTIQLFYTVPAYQFSAGYFGSFQLDMGIQRGKSNPPTNYNSLTLTLKQTGSANLELVPGQDTFNIADADWTGSTVVHINIPAAVANNPAFGADGTTLVGNLQMVAPGGSHLDTVTTIQVRLILAHPTDCLKTYSLITNNDNTAQVNLIQVSKQSNNQKVSSNPQNPHYIIIVANICDVAQCVDTGFTLNSDFQLKQGQPVKTFSSNSLIDSTAELFAFFSSTPVATPQGTAMCLSAPASATCGSGGIPINGGATFLVKADFEIKTSASFPPPAQYNGFGASLLEGGSTDNCTAPGMMNYLAYPNPTTWTVNAQCVDGPGKVSCTP